GDALVRESRLQARGDRMQHRNFGRARNGPRRIPRADDRRHPSWRRGCALRDGAARGRRPRDGVDGPKRRVRACTPRSRPSGGCRAAGLPEARPARGGGQGGESRGARRGAGVRRTAPHRRWRRQARCRHASTRLHSLPTVARRDREGRGPRWSRGRLRDHDGALVSRSPCVASAHQRCRARRARALLHGFGRSVPGDRARDIPRGSARGPRDEPRVNVVSAITGLPYVGKTTLFNLLTGAHASTGAFAGAEAETNVGVAKVPDRRVADLSALYKPKKITYAEVMYRDIGLAHSEKPGQAISTQKLGDLRTADAIVHVVRAFSAPSVPHAAGSVDPVRDLST